MSESPCEHSADAVGWVLGALSPEEAARFAAHLEGCAKCRAEVARLTEAAEQLAEAPPVLTPPPELRERLMGAVRAEMSLSNAARVDPQTSPVRRRGRLRAAGAMLAVFASIAVGVLTITLLTTSHGSHQAPMRTVIGTVTPQGGGTRAHAVVQIAPQTATLIVTHLAAPPGGRVYQAWVIRRNSPATATGALFSVPRSGNTRILLPALHDVTEVIVTAEPPRGSATPTLPPIVLAQLSARPGATALKP